MRYGSDHITEDIYICIEREIYLMFYAQSTASREGSYQGLFVCQFIELLYIAPPTAQGHLRTLIRNKIDFILVP